MTPFSQDEEATIEKKLLQNAMKSNWKEVINLYKSYPDAHYARITRSGDTALHIAISDGQESTVRELVDMVEIEALRIENDVGNTPLHLAAYLGNAKMCSFIATQEPGLIGIRNEDKETPLFLAVLHGRKDAFLCLSYFCKDVENRYDYCRGKDGDTILHSAINGEYFEIAVHIIRDYKKLANWTNFDGLSPLDILARKPSIFRSGSHIRGFQQLIYNCIPVDELNLDASDPAVAEGSEYNHKINSKYPANYQTCIGIFLLARNTVRVAIKKFSKSGPDSGQQHDEESRRQSPILTVVREQATGPTKVGPSTTCFNFVKFLIEAMSKILVLGSSQAERMKERKKKHVWSVQIMRELIELASLYEYENSRKRPPPSAPGFDFTLSHEFDQEEVKDYPETSIQNRKFDSRRQALEVEKKDAPLLIAAKNGIIEMVTEILDQFPVAINDVNSEKKNIVLLAVKNRQPHIYKFLQGRKIMTETIFRKTDKDGNSALHIAALMGDTVYSTNAALQLQWEYKWFQYVTQSMPLNYFVRHNAKGKTASEIFNESHKRLLREAGWWLKDTSTSCSVVAGLVFTVSFATSATVPGGVRERNGAPTLQHEAAFSIFAISSLTALCSSFTSIIMFLAIFTASYNEKGFNRVLQKLLVGLGSLFVSLSATLVSFCASQFLIMKDQLKYAALPLYVVIFIVMTCYVILQFPWYFDVALITMARLPPKINNSFE